MARGQLVPLPGSRGQFLGRFVSQSRTQDHIVIVTIKPPKRGASNVAYEFTLNGGLAQAGYGTVDDLKTQLNVALLNADINLWRYGKADRPDPYNRPKVRFE